MFNHDWIDSRWLRAEQMRCGKFLDFVEPAQPDGYSAIEIYSLRRPLARDPENRQVRRR